MNSSIIHDDIGSLLNKNCHTESYHGDIKYNITLNIILSIVVTLASTVVVG